CVLAVDEVATTLVLLLGPGLLPVRSQRRSGYDPGHGLAVEFEHRSGRIDGQVQDKLLDRFINAVPCLRAGIPARCSRPSASPLSRCDAPVSPPREPVPRTRTAGGCDRPGRWPLLYS